MKGISSVRESKYTITLAIFQLPPPKKGEIKTDIKGQNTEKATQ